MLNKKFTFKTAFTGITRKEAATLIADHFGTKAVYKGGQNFVFTILDGNRSEWRVQMDSGITPRKSQDSNLVEATTDYKVVVETPPLEYAMLEDTLGVFDALYKAGALTNESCRADVGISSDGHTGISMKNLVNIVSGVNEKYP
jgi:hypothetical protein